MIKITINRLPLKTSTICLVCRNSSSNGVVIPNRIERGPTDILKALASTVKTDYSAAHYKYHDDPFLIPRSYLDKRSFALAKESGRKAAKYFLNNYPQLFYRDDAEPKIPAFSYKDVFNPELVYDESDLVNCIATTQVENSIQVSNSCKSKGVDLSDGVILSLLELVCFYNSTDESDPEFLEERWFKSQETDKGIKLWKDDSFAEELFRTIEDKKPEHYAAIIRGLVKYNAGTRAYQLYQEARDAGIIFDVETYNHLFRTVPFVRDSPDARWELALEMMNEMNSFKIVPNADTFFEVLQIIVKSGGWQPSQVCSLKLMSEMKRLKIKPTLAIFHSLNYIHHRPGQVSQILPSILGILENERLEVKHQKDFDFFPFAMKICADHYGSLELGYRIHSLLTSDNNTRFLADGPRENMYYQNFFILLAETESIENLFQWYDRYVPNVHSPTGITFNAIIRAIEVNQAYQYLPRIFDDVVAGDGLKDSNCAQFAEILDQANVDDDENRDLLSKLALDLFNTLHTSVVDAYTRSEERVFQKSSDSWNGKVLSSIVSALIKFGKPEEAFNVTKRMLSCPIPMTGELSPEILENLCLFSIKSGNVKECSFLLRFATQFGNNLEPFIESNLEKADESIQEELRRIISRQNETPA